MMKNLKLQSSAELSRRLTRAISDGKPEDIKTINTNAIEKPTLQQIRQQTTTSQGKPITRQDIATLSGLTYGEVYVIETGGHISDDKIKRVIRAFNALSGLNLRLFDIRHGNSSV